MNARWLHGRNILNIASVNKDFKNTGWTVTRPIRRKKSIYTIFFRFKWKKNVSVQAWLAIIGLQVFVSNGNKMVSTYPPLIASIDWYAIAYHVKRNVHSFPPFSFLFSFGHFPPKSQFFFRQKNLFSVFSVVEQEWRLLNKERGEKKREIDICFG